jgi:ABC-2 type transport system ATP-binding protein
MASDPAVEFDGVRKSYPHGLLGRRRLPAVRDVSFTVARGEVVGLVGPNRSGKTTLAKILLSLCRADAGAARRFGRPVADRATLARVGYVHENQAFPRHLTARETLGYYGALSLLPEPVVARRATALLERVGLADRAREPIARFSKGMAQRLALAQALLNEPDLLVLDEPSEGLDLDGRLAFREALVEHRRNGGAVLLISHLLPEIETLCDRVAVLHAGRVVWCGPTPDLLRDPSGAPRTLEQALSSLANPN